MGVARDAIADAWTGRCPSLSLWVSDLVQLARVRTICATSGPADCGLTPLRLRRVITIAYDPGRAAQRHHHGQDTWSAQAALETMAVLGLGAELVDVTTWQAETTSTVTLVVDEPGPSTARAILQWVDAGGILIVAGGDPTWTGITGREVGESLVVLGESVRSDDGPASVRAFSGWALHPIAGAVIDAVWASDGAPAIVRTLRGHGCLAVVGPDIWEAIVRISQGWPVRADGTPQPDGSAPLDDGTLKTDDGIALSFEEDRVMADGSPVPDVVFPHEWPPRETLPFFGSAHVDLWREALLHLVLAATDHLPAPLPIVYFWPHGSPAVGHVSHDSDANTDASGWAALECFAELDLHVTWCFMYPGGYSASIYEAAAAAGHEAALHYNAMLDTPDCVWGKDELRQQYAWAERQAGADIVTNKNHFTRWEGWDDFFLWCEDLGILVEQSHGPSVQGAIGFPFGTCHPHFPVASAGQDNRRIDVLSMPLQTQDLHLTCTREVKDAMAAEVLRRHGVLHLLFHGQHVELIPEVREALVEAVTSFRAAGAPFLTAAQIHAWEVTRRQIRVNASQHDDVIDFVVQSGTDVGGLTLIFKGSVGAYVATDDVQVSEVTRFGRSFQQLVLDVRAGTTKVTVMPGQR